MTQYLLDNPKKTLGMSVVAGLLFTALLLNTVWDYTVNKEREGMVKESKILSLDFTSSLVTTVQSINDLSLLFRASEQVTADEFQIFSTSMLSRHKFIKAALFMPLVTEGNRVAFEQKMIDSGYLNFREIEFSSSILDEHLEKDIHLPVEFVEPFTVKNSTLLGWDALSHPKVSAGIQLSINNGSPFLLDVVDGFRAFKLDVQVF